MSPSTDYGRPVRKSPSLYGRKSTPNPKFIGTAEAYLVCHIGLKFQISLIYAFNGCPLSVLLTHSHKKSDSITRKKLIDSWVTCRRQASSALCYTAVLFTPGRALMWHEYRLASRKAVICCWLIHRPVFDAHRHHEIIPTSFMSVMPIDYTVPSTYGRPTI